MVLLNSERLAFIKNVGMVPQVMQQGSQGPSFSVATPMTPFTYGPIPYNNFHTKVNSQRLERQWRIGMHDSPSYSSFFFVVSVQSVMGPYIAVHGAPVHVPLPMFAASSQSTFIVIAVPDECVGAILGRGGKTILDIQQVWVFVL